MFLMTAAKLTSGAMKKSPLLSRFNNMREILVSTESKIAHFSVKGQGVWAHLKLN